MTGKTVKDNGEIEINDPEKANCHTEVNMIDKDLTNIDLLNKYYPNTKSLLCTFHVLKWFKKLVNDNIRKEHKSQVQDILTKMVKALNQEMFEESFGKLKEFLATDYQSLLDNINRNWMPNVEQWVHYYRFKIFHRGTNTNNRLERYNRTIKHNALKPTQHLSEAIKQLVKHAEYSYRESLKVNYTYLFKHI